MRFELYLLYSPLLINGFLFLSSLVDVGHIDLATLNTGVLSSLFLLAYIVICLSLYLPSLVLESHCYNNVVHSVSDLSGMPVREH